MNSKFEDELKQIKPKEITESEKNLMWSKIEKIIKSITNTENNMNNKTLWSFFNISYMKVTVSVLLILFVVSSSSVTFALANNSVPGDFLFPIDIAGEKFQLLISSSGKKDELRISFAKERLDEVKIILSLNEIDEPVEILVVKNNTNNSTTTTNDDFIVSVNGATSTATTTKKKNDNKININFSKKSFDRKNSVLASTLDRLIETRVKILASQNEEALFMIDKMIEELISITENRIDEIEKIKLKIEDSKDKYKINADFSTEDLRIKFKFSEIKKDNSTSTKFVFEERFDIKKDNKKEKDDKDNLGRNNRDDDDDENNDDKKDDKKITICHKGNTISVSKSSLFAHRLHGDINGKCKISDEDDDDDTATTTPDTIKPVITSLISTPNINSAVIKWDTSESTDGFVWYGTTTPLVIKEGSLKNSDLNFSLTHSITISGLSEDTTYFYVVTSKDIAKNTATSTENSFITLPDIVLDTTPPIISGIGATNTATGTANILWTTDEEATSKVWYSLISPVEKSTTTPSVLDTNLTLNHNLEITGLTASSTYFYIISSSDNENNTRESSEGSFFIE